MIYLAFPVQCGEGSFYNSTVKQCTFCPIGTYSAASGKTDGCDKCGSTTTTLQKGSKLDTDCVGK